MVSVHITVLLHFVMIWKILNDKHWIWDKVKISLSLRLRHTCTRTYVLLIWHVHTPLVKQSTNSNSEFKFYGHNIKKNHPYLMLLYFYKWAAYFLIQYHSSSVIIQTTAMRVSLKHIIFSNWCCQECFYVLIKVFCV